MIFKSMWNFASIPDFESKGEDSLYMCETFNYIRKRIQAMMSFLLGEIIIIFEMLNDHLLTDEYTNYVRKRIHSIMIFLIGVL